MLRKRIPIGAGVIIVLFGLVFVGGVAVAVTNETANLDTVKEPSPTSLDEVLEATVSEEVSESPETSIAVVKPEFHCQIQEVELRYRDTERQDAEESNQIDGEAKKPRALGSAAQDAVFVVDPTHHGRGKPLSLFVRGESNNAEVNLVLAVSVAKQLAENEKKFVYEREFTQNSADFISGVELELEGLILEPMQEFLGDLREYEFSVGIKQAEAKIVTQNGSEMGTENSVGLDSDADERPDESLMNADPEASLMSAGPEASLMSAGPEASLTNAGPEAFLDTATILALYPYGWGDANEETWPVLMPELKVAVGTTAGELIDRLATRGNYEIQVVSENPESLAPSEAATPVETGAHLMLADATGTRLAEIQTIAVGGDCNGDGKISAIDLLVIRSYLIGKMSLSRVEQLAADFSGDGAVSALDLLITQRYLIANR